MKRSQFFCGCAGVQHAINRAQRRYCRDALTVAYATRDRAAIAKIQESLGSCPHRNPPGQTYEEAQANIRAWRESLGEKR